MNLIEEIEYILHYDTKFTLPVLLKHLQSLFERNIATTDNIIGDLIDLEFLEDIRKIIDNEDAIIYFGKTLRDLRCSILDEGFREHVIFIKYREPKKLIITSLQLPHSSFQDKEYDSLEKLISEFKEHCGSLLRYFYELEQIDRFCTVMEPAAPSFKDDYRRILLDERNWLHVEVTPGGLATNIHLVGQSNFWSNKMQVGLQSWNHDIDIVENILYILDLVNFPVASNSSTISTTSNDKPPSEIILCCICLCAELPENPSLPLPLCKNTTCGMYFHKNCLFQWLVACSGGRPPAFGVVTGNCPACRQSITCGERDD